MWISSLKQCTGYEDIGTSARIIIHACPFLPSPENFRFINLRSCDSHVEDCGDSAEVGYDTEAYTPAESASLAEEYDTNLISGDDSDFIGTISTLDCNLYSGEENMGVGKLGTIFCSPRVIQHSFGPKVYCLVVRLDVIHKYYDDSVELLQCHFDVISRKLQAGPIPRLLASDSAKYVGKDSSHP